MKLNVITHNWYQRGDLGVMNSSIFSDKNLDEFLKDSSELLSVALRCKVDGVNW